MTKIVSICSYTVLKRTTPFIFILDSDKIGSQKNSRTRQGEYDMKKGNLTKDEQDRIKNIYKRNIIELVEGIDRQVTLTRIYSFIRGLPDK